MKLYPTLVFLHVLGAVGMFAVWAIEATVLTQLTRSTMTGEAGAWLRLRRRVVPLAAASMGTALVTGLAMMKLSWGAEPWMLTAIALLTVIGVVGVMSERRYMRPLAAAVVRDGERLPAVARQLTARLDASLRIRVAAGIGILGLMTLQPGLAGSLVIAGLALIVGAAAAFLAGRAAPSMERAGEAAG